MGERSAIEWTDATWNPVTGCSKVSPGCARCYAETFALTRLKGKVGYTGLPWTPENAAANVLLRPERLYLPLRWKQPKRIFVNSLSDLFHELVPDGYVGRAWDVMGRAGWHTFQVLTKRPERMREWATRWADRSGDELVEFGRDRRPEAVRARFSSGRAHLFAAMLENLGEPPEGSSYPLYDWMEGWRYWPRILPNVWLGTSVENDRWTSRVDELRETPAAVRFLSCEPLLGPLPSLDLTGIDWVIVGGESGPGARPMHSSWARDIRDRCAAAGVAFTFKQWGAWQRGSEFRDDAMVMARDGRLVAPEDVRGVFLRDDPATLDLEYIRRTTKHHAGRELDGRTWDEYPAVGW
jgi:protein gp37